MKRTIVCILTVFACLAVSAQVEIKVLKVDTIKPVQNICQSVPVSHWSVAIKGGFDNFLMSPPAPSYADRFNTTYGGVIEYSFNPFFGLGLEYDFSDYSRPYTWVNPSDALEIIGAISGATNDVTLFGSVNLSNAIAPFRVGFWRRLSIYGDVGAGLAMYKGSLDGLPSTLKTSVLGKLGLSADLRLNRTLSLLLEGKYHQYDATTMCDGSRSNRNADALFASVGLRIKLNATKVGHARNISVREYSPEPIPIIIQKTIQKGDTEEVLTRLKTAENLNSFLKERVQKLEDEAQKVSQ